MNFMGVGLMELAVILLVAFLVLGPGRSIDMARKSGKLLGDLRRTFGEVTDAISIEQQQEQRGEQRPPPSAAAPPPPGVPTRPDLPDDDDAAAPAAATPPPEPSGQNRPGPKG